MRHSFHRFGIVAVLYMACASLALAEDGKDEAIRQDREQIAGRWRIVELHSGGNRVADEDAQKLTVVNEPDGDWSLHSEGEEISHGTSTLDPTKRPKTIDFTPLEGDDKGKLYLGIYELGEQTRKMCFAPPGEPRPTEFTSPPGSQHVLVIYEREPAKAPEPTP